MTWTIHPRDANLERTLDPLSSWSQLDVVERHVSNGPPMWILTGRSDALPTFTPGMGTILYDDGAFVTSGRMRTIDRAYDADPLTGRLADITTLGFIGDRDELWSRRCWPDPSHALSSTPSSFSASHDVRTGAREDSLLGYIADNLGPAAPIASRRLAELLVPTSAGRGGTATYEARMDALGQVVADLAEGGDLDVDIVHDESTGTPRLAVVVTDVDDVSADIVFGSLTSARTSGKVTAWRYRMQAPEITDAVVFAAGELSAREAALYTNEGAVTLWGRRREALVDQRQTSDSTVMADAANRELERGATPVAVTLTLADGGDAVYRDTYGLGSRVGVELPGLPLAIPNPRVREVMTTVRPREVVSRKVTVGIPGATTIQDPTDAQMVELQRRLAQLERSR